MMSLIQVSSTSARYRQDIKINHQFDLTADEPQDLGGDDAGATPVELVFSGLGACKTITLKMYAERQGWELTSVNLDISQQKSDRQSTILVQLSLEGNLTK